MTEQQRCKKDFKQQHYSTGSSPKTRWQTTKNMGQGSMIVA